MTDKKERKISPRNLLKKANSGAIGAMAFVKAYREYLTTGDLGAVTGPIVEKLDSGELFPTPAMSEIKVAIMGHIMLVDAAKTQRQQETADAPKTTRTKKAFEACIRSGHGAILADAKGKPMVQSFDLPQRASDWVDRRLFEQASDSYGEVTHLKAHNPDHATDTIFRDDSIARILGSTGAPTVCKGSKQSSTLGFGVKVKESKCTFSRG